MPPMAIGKLQSLPLCRLFNRGAQESGRGGHSAGAQERGTWGHSQGVEEHRSTGERHMGTQSRSKGAQEHRREAHGDTVKE